MRKCFYFFFFFFLPSFLWGYDLKAVAESPEWLTLLHYNQSITVHDLHKSYIDDPHFFLSKEGKSNPLLELQATIAAVEKKGSAERCQFPSRYAFLAKKLGWADDDAFAHCTEYLEWRRKIPSANALLIFPASYLNSPSSMFGHVLLRLDTSKHPEDVWSSWAINFGADISNLDNSIVYAWRGLGGGYPGRFTIVPYVSKIQEYSHLENRDMWEYTLNLNTEEISRLIDHLWELHDINFDYYFLDENCALRLLELLAVAKPDASIIDGFRLAEVPVSTVRIIEKKGLVVEKSYRPSKAVELQADIDALSAKERKFAHRLMQNPSLSETPEFLSFSTEKRHLMARTAWRALRLAERKKDRTDDVAARSMALLLLMQANTPVTVTIPLPSPPEEGHGLQMFSIGGGHTGSANFSELSYRMTYHDLLDNPPGFLQGAQIKGFDLRVRATEAAPKLESLELLNIRSLSPRNTFIKPLSWFVQTGFERINTFAERPLVGFLQGGAGLSWRIGDIQPYALASARFEHNPYFKPFIETGIGGSVGFLGYFSHGQINLSANGLYFENDEYRYQGQLEANLPLGKQNALRFLWKRDFWRNRHQQEVGLAWHHYFD